MYFVFRCETCYCGKMYMLEKEGPCRGGRRLAAAREVAGRAVRMGERMLVLRKLIKCR